MAATDDSLQIRQFIPGKRSQVFRAWTEKELVDKWLCPEQCRVVANEARVAPGGTYRETMQCGETLYTVCGTYREIIPDRKLVFTHRWEDPEAVETVVAVDFADRDGGSEITLTQIGFAGAASARSHEEGWASALKNLARLFS